ncbi:MAG TPA: hypothetical protein VE650_06745 [Acetobacteraceae bacterium]|nr:hypothetical protein [Acetobacteraceae bacterium]
MPHAVAASFPLPRPCPGVTCRAAGRWLAGFAQVAGLAAVLWLLVAGPGFLTDAASVVPAGQQDPR